MISQELYIELHEREFKEAKYAFAKGLNEAERADKNRLNLQDRISTIADEVFHKAKVCGTNNLLELDSSILLEQNQILKQKSDELQGLCADYALMNNENSVPDSEKAFVYGDIASGEIIKAIILGD